MRLRSLIVLGLSFLLCSCGTVRKTGSSNSTRDTRDSVVQVSKTDFVERVDSTSVTNTGLNTVTSIRDDEIVDFEITIYDNDRKDSTGTAPVKAIVKGKKQAAGSTSTTTAIQVVQKVEKSTDKAKKDSTETVIIKHEKEDQNTSVEIQKELLQRNGWVAWMLIGFIICLFIVVVIKVFKLKYFR